MNQETLRPFVYGKLLHASKLLRRIEDPDSPELLRIKQRVVDRIKLAVAHSLLPADTVKRVEDTRNCDSEFSSEGGIRIFVSASVGYSESDRFLVDGAREFDSLFGLNAAVENANEPDCFRFLPGPLSVPASHGLEIVCYLGESVRDRWPIVRDVLADSVELLANLIASNPDRVSDVLAPSSIEPAEETQRDDSFAMVPSSGPSVRIPRPRKDPLEYFDSELSGHMHLVYLAYRCAFLGEDIDTSETWMIEKFGRKIRYVLAKSPRDNLTWPKDAAKRFAKLMRVRGVRKKTDGLHKWVLHPGVHDRIQEIAKKEGW